MTCWHTDCSVGVQRIVFPVSICIRLLSRAAPKSKITVSKGSKLLKSELDLTVFTFPFFQNTTPPPYAAALPIITVRSAICLCKRSKTKPRLIKMVSDRMKKLKSRFFQGCNDSTCKWKSQFLPIIWKKFNSPKKLHEERSCISEDIAQRYMSPSIGHLDHKNESSHIPLIKKKIKTKG